MEQTNYPEIAFKTHRATVSVNDSKIYCFKYVNDRCDFEIFDDYESAKEWIISPFPSIVYRTVLDEPVKK